MMLGVTILAVITGTLLVTQAPRINEWSYEYPLHKDVPGTVFWIGEDANNSNGFIHNRSSAWTGDWTKAYGGTDNPDNRCGYAPCGFTPKENPFYFALPFGDYTEDGIKSREKLMAIPWYSNTVKEGESLLKNRWIEVGTGTKKAYAQWEDVGPFNEDDADYVFGGARPKYPHAGIDLSPALADYLEIDGHETVSWRFIDEQDVPDGPWRETITRSKPD